MVRSCQLPKHWWGAWVIVEPTRGSLQKYQSSGLDSNKKFFFWERVGFYLYRTLTTKPPDQVPLKEKEITHKFSKGASGARRRRRPSLPSPDSPPSPQWRRSRMKLPADSRIDEESSNFEPISSTSCCWNDERPGQTSTSPGTDASRITSEFRPTSNNHTKGIQEHQPAYRSWWSFNLQRKTPWRDTNPMNIPSVKASSLLQTTAKLKVTDWASPLTRGQQTTQEGTQKILASTQEKPAIKKSPKPNLLQEILSLYTTRQQKSTGTRPPTT